MATLPPLLDRMTLAALYSKDPGAVREVMREVARRMEAGDPAVFIARRNEGELLAEAEALLARAPDPASLPLWGLPFAVKDNIDVVGLPTTAACPAFAYHPSVDATIVARLKAAGAIVTGKTNLDQFATGLNGTRSPYGAPRCVFNKDYVSGGSSSGSAVAVAAGAASFSLGTDTAGSGRVPAAFNNLVGLKPTNGLFPNTGSVPACKSLDCITVFAPSVADALAVRRAGEGYDPADSYSRRITPRSLPAKPRIGVLAQSEREFFGDPASAAAYDAAIERARVLGATITTFDYAPFREIAALLYEGPWVAERLAAIEAFFETGAAEMDPTVRSIIGGAKGRSAVESFRGHYKLEALKQKTATILNGFDMLMLPTSPTIHTVEAMLADPVRLNSQFGRYTNFANFLGFAALAVPAGFRPDGLPFGVTLFAPGGTDEALAPFADALHRAAACGAGIDRAFTPPPLPTLGPTGLLEIVVVGAHLSGLPLNHQLTERGGHLVRATETAADYRLYRLPGGPPLRPGLIRVPPGEGAAIKVEVWALPIDTVGSFLAGIPSPLGLGTVKLADGTSVKGFICEAEGARDAEDVSTYGGWRAYLAR